jgi:hypothetical protein
VIFVIRPPATLNEQIVLAAADEIKRAVRLLLFAYRNVLVQITLVAPGLDEAYEINIKEATPDASF